MDAHRYDPESLAAAMRPLLASHQAIAAAWLFGSAARGEMQPDSDVDVGLLLRDRKDTGADRYELLGCLAAHLERITSPHAVDLVLLEPQGCIFRHRVLCEGRLIVENDRERRIDFETETVMRALDFRPTHELAVVGQAAGIRRRLREAR